MFTVYIIISLICLLVAALSEPENAIDINELEQEISEINNPKIKDLSITIINQSMVNPLFIYLLLILISFTPIVHIVFIISYLGKK